MFEYIAANLAPLLSGTLIGSILGFLISQLVSHFLAKSRDKENFHRNVNHNKLEENKVTLNVLGSFLNGILRCWEEASYNAMYAHSFKDDRLIERYRNVSFNEYPEFKDQLVARGVFPPLVWHSCDNLPSQIEEANNMVLNGSLHQAPVRLSHFADMCEMLWGIAAKAYQSNGGDINSLTRPMPCKYQKYGQA